MDRIRNKKLALKRRVEDLIIAEKNWILLQINAQIKHLSLTESMQLANSLKQKAETEIFKLHPGGIRNAEYIAEQMETRAHVLGRLILEEAQNVARNQVDRNVALYKTDHLGRRDNE